MGSNPTEGIDVCLLGVLCVVQVEYLRRSDPSSRGVLQSGCVYVCVCVCVAECAQEQ